MVCKVIEILIMLFCNSKALIKLLIKINFLDLFVCR